MPSYTTLIVLALVASNVSPALSAPVRREQSLSHRGPAVGEAVGEAGKKSALKKHGKAFLIGTAATMAFAYVFEKLGGSVSIKSGSTPSSPYPSSPYPSSPYPPSPYPSSPYPSSPYPSSPYPSSPYPSSPYPPSPYSPSTNPTYSTSTNPTYSTSNPTYSTYPTPQIQNGYQQRAVDRDLPADIFEVRPTSNNNDQNRRGLTRNHRQTASLDLSGRADLEAIRLFSRMLDDLD